MTNKIKVKSLFGGYLDTYFIIFKKVYILFQEFEIYKMGEKIKLYVGSLPFDTRGGDLEEMFSKYGHCYNGKKIYLSFLELKLF